jgi:hypothetical protein
MKYLYQYTLITLMTFLSCSKDLDLLPYQSLDESVAINSDANVKVVLNGAYDAIAEGDFLGGNVLRNAELLGGDDEVVWVGTYTGPRDIFNKKMVKTNTDAEDCWLKAYKVINITNNVLSALSVVNEADRSKVEGEAKFLRALTYFELVRFYAQTYISGTNNAQNGVPLVLTPTKIIDGNSNVSRSSVDAVYKQIIADLNSAKDLLPEENEWRASKGAATALLARVSLQMSDFEKARDYANEVITSKVYSLVKNYADIFGRDENSSEDIFAIQVSSQDGVNYMNTFFSVPDFGGRDGDIEILPAHLSLYAADDDRLALFFIGNDAMRSGKWNNQYGNISIIRLAEMYLIRAEANFRLNSAVGATPTEDINTIAQRAKQDAISTVTLNDILLERRKELAHEGFKIHDMKRNMLDVGNLPFNDPKLVFPIPFRETQANSNLQQNDGY